MAVSSTNTKPRAAATAPAAPAANPVSGSPFQTPRFGLKSSFDAAGDGGAYFEKLFAAITKSIKGVTESNTAQEKYAAYKLIKSQYGVNYSGIVLTETVADLTTAHILLVERTGDYPEKLIETVNNTRYEILRTPADAMDEKYAKAAEQLIASTQAGQNVSAIIIADATLVPNEFNPDSEADVASLISNSFQATHAETAIVSQGYQGVDLRQLIEEHRSGKFTIGMAFNTDSSILYNQVGMPVRQDICVTLGYKTNNNRRDRSVNQGDDVVQIVRTYGYIDFDFVGMTVANGMQQPQRFMPNFVITHIEAGVAPTPDIVMLAVASVLAVGDDSYWIQSFRPSVVRKGQVDNNDVGALNIEGNLENSPTGFGKRFDTKSKTVTPIEITKLIQTLVRPNMTVSIDLPKAGPETWYTSVFRHIKTRPGSNQRALERVFGHMSCVTGGAFSGTDLPMFTSTHNRIHGGYYKVDGQFQDLRHLSSYLAVANHVTDTNQLPQLITQYTNTMYNQSIPSDLRASARFQYLQDMSKGTAVVKQMYDRATFNGAFLGQWVRALHSIGFDPVLASTNADGADLFMKRSTLADFQSGVVTDVRFLSSGDNGYGAYTSHNQWYNRSY